MTRSELMNLIASEMDGALSGCKSNNPLEAWSMFVDRLDGRGRRRIGDTLELAGKNRYTGEPILKGEIENAETVQNA